jgi:hypothetical protein
VTVEYPTWKKGDRVIMANGGTGTVLSQDYRTVWVREDAFPAKTHPTMQKVCLADKLKPEVKP